jgi:hypothetical protein
MKPDKEAINLTHSYLALRNAVGWIGILLPFTLMLGVYCIYGGRFTLATISQYYYTGMRDVFVGAICAIALFLFFYRGYDRWDDLLANIAGFCALCVAWFPTTESGPLDLSGTIHFVAASIFFVILSAFSIFIFTRKGESPTRQKLTRNVIYIVCGSVMIACLVSIMIYFYFTENNGNSSFVCWAETLALVAFGVSWLTKGGTIQPDKKRMKK